jgi:dTDP-4-dehydrorhamnose reductase
VANILITGGSGLLAVNWAKQVGGINNVILGLHNRKVNLPSAKSINLNLESVNDIKKVLDDFSIDVVIHTAAISNVELCESQPLLAQHVNVQLAKSVALASKLHGSKLIHISTDHLFDGCSEMRSENDVIRPLNIYAKTKAQSESIVLELCPSALIVRTNFYGWGTTYRESFSDQVIKALQNGKKIYLFEDVFYTPILMNVQIDVVHKLINNNKAGIFNIVGDQRLSKYDFGKLVAEKFNLDSSLIERSQLRNRSDLVKRPLDMSLTNKKINMVLGFQIGDVSSHLAIMHKSYSILGKSNQKTN